MRRDVRACVVGWSVGVLAVTALAGAPGAQAATRTCAGRAATIVGTSGDDVLKGTSGADVIVAGDGDDTVDAGAGADIICGGPGDDTIRASKGPDRVRGQEGDDSIDPGEGDDVVDGGAGTDTLRERSDVGGTINLPSGTSTGTGSDQVEGLERVRCSGAGSYQVYAATGTQLVSISGVHDDQVITADVDSGIPLTLALGAGEDHYVVRQAGVHVVEDLPGSSGGYDLVDVSTDGTTTIGDAYGGLRVDTSAAGREVIDVSAGLDPIYLTTGAGGDDLTVVSGGGSVYVDTGDGADSLTADVGTFSTVRLGGGPDRLEAMATTDVSAVDGGTGTDLVLGSTGRDVVDLASGLWTSAGRAVTLTGFEQVQGRAGDDVLRGSDDPDDLRGGSGADVLAGRDGDDLLDGNDGRDSAKGGAGTDLCRAEQRQDCER